MKKVLSSASAAAASDAMDPAAFNAEDATLAEIAVGTEIIVLRYISIPPNYLVVGHYFTIYGLVLFKVQRRNQTTHLNIAFEGAPEAVVVTAKLYHFSLEDIKEDDFVSAMSRDNISCIIRFSEPPASEQRQTHLCQEVRSFLLMYPDKSVMLLCVFRPTEEDLQRIKDMAGLFNNYCVDPPTAKQWMTQVFSAACSALSSLQCSLLSTISHQYCGR
ncbi:hypothetical protein Aduo_019307 [Ancylostoma duodenale]